MKIEKKIRIGYLDGTVIKGKSFEEIEKKTGKKREDLEKEGGITIKSISIGTLHQIIKKE